MSSDSVDGLIALFADRGDNVYLGEAVTQAEHALQSAALAEAANAPPVLIVAALLHDIGHLVETVGEPAADPDHDARHEVVGAAYLATLFGPALVEPIRLHVPAKRYLCAIDQSYGRDLSAASKRSLALQGGAFDFDAAERFVRLPYAQDAVRLRRWDDHAKSVGRATKPVSAYRDLILAVLAAYPAA